MRPGGRAVGDASFPRQKRRLGWAVDHVQMHLAGIEHVLREIQHRVPERAGAEQAIILRVLVLDLPVEAAQRLAEARVGKGAREGDGALGVEADASGDLPDVGIEFGNGAALDMALEQPYDPSARDEQSDRDGDAAQQEKAEP